MKSRSKSRRIQTVALGVAVCFTAMVGPVAAWAQMGTLAEPFSRPAPNAALHYHRALLLMSALDEDDRSLLQRDVWELLSRTGPSKGQAARIKRMLYRARHAADAAGSGSRLRNCDFGIDFADAGGATLLPHASPMAELGRLLVLRGAYAQSEEKWDEAAVIYFDALRMGRHLSHQPTLIEAVAGMSIQENAFHALAHWAAACPDSDAVARVFGLFEIMADDLVNPASTLASETAILALDFEFLENTYPRGPWGTAFLRAMDQEPGEDERENRKAAVAACIKAGVPAEVFESEAAVLKYLAGLKELDLRFAEAAATCMKLSPQARVKRGQRLYEQYTKAAGAIGEQTLLNPAEIGALFAGHEAKILTLRLALAVAARKGVNGYPASLDAVAGGFGGVVPVSPYDGSNVKYDLLSDGQAFRLAIEEIRVVGVVLPRVEFSSDTPEAAK